MAGIEIFDHLAALAYPMPTDPAKFDPDLLADVQDHIRQQREDHAHNLRCAWEAEDHDPLLTETEQVRRQREEVDRQLRRLIAYGAASSSALAPTPWPPWLRPPGFARTSRRAPSTARPRSPPSRRLPAPSGARRPNAPKAQGTTVTESTIQRTQEQENQ